MFGPLGGWFGSSKVANSVRAVRVSFGTNVLQLHTLTHGKVQGAGLQDGNSTGKGPVTLVKIHNEVFVGRCQKATGILRTPPTWALTGQSAQLSLMLGPSYPVQGPR